MKHKDTFLYLYVSKNLLIKIYKIGIAIIVPDIFVSAIKAVIKAKITVFFILEFLFHFIKYIFIITFNI